MQHIAEQFALEGTIIAIEAFGSGHIHGTYRVTTTADTYTLQRVNTHVFADMEGLMANVQQVTAYLRERIEAEGGDPTRETLQVIPTCDGRAFFRDEDGSCYRVYRYIGDTFVRDVAQSPDDLYASGYAFGRFQALLSDYPAHTLKETIRDFHHTGKRFATFLRAVEADVCGRASQVQEEIAFIVAREGLTHAVTDRLADGTLPLRVTHNDTKLNNVLFDEATGRGLCVIDLDTVMPGSSLYDFGDAIRFGASTAEEDERDLSKVHFDPERYAAYTKGYLEACGRLLTEEEIRLLPLSARLLTLECGMRFLTDYLEGDVYFATHREGQNLDRCRTQLKLIVEMEAQEAIMAKIVEEAVKAL